MDASFKVTFRGVRGSIGTPLSAEQIEEKLALALDRAQPEDLKDASSREAFIKSLPFEIRGCFGGNTSCVQIEVGGEQLIFDAGTGIRQLGLDLMAGDFGKGQGRGHIFFTHTHWDHIQGLPFFTPLYIKGNHFTFHSPYENLKERLEGQQFHEYFPVPYRAYSSSLEISDLSNKMEANKSKRARLIDYFFYRLWKYSQSISGFQLSQIESSDHTNQTIGSKLVDFTLKYPESGNLPQYLTAQLLAGLFRTSEIEVVGGDESVFGINTTSKKPADIWLEVEGVPTNLYEVTVKPVSLKRLDDSLDALHTTGHLDYPVTFICRIDLDVQELSLENGSFQYKGKRFDFIDYKFFCLSVFALLNEEECSTVLANVAKFVQDKNISMRTKSGWNEFFKNEI